MMAGTNTCFTPFYCIFVSYSKFFIMNSFKKPIRNFNYLDLLLDTLTKMAVLNDTIFHNILRFPILTIFV
jgi:hypothetical protein